MIRLPMPHAGQRAVLDSPARFRWLAAGRRWRKTSVCMIAAVLAVLKGQRIIWAAPTYDQCRIGWHEAYRALAGHAHLNLSRMEMDLNGHLSFRSLDDPDNVRGHTADGVVIDEAGYVQARAWYEVVRPMLSDTDGWALAAGTPNGRNWFAREHEAATEYDDAESWSVPTLGVSIENEELRRAPHALENPSFTFDEAVRLFDMMPRRLFEQEFLAAFVDDAGGVFRRVAERAIVEAEEAPVEGHHYLFGVDWGKLHDFTVIIVLDATTRRVVHMDRQRRVDYQFQLARLRMLYQCFRPRAIVAERNAMGEAIIEQLEAQALPVESFTTTAQSKADAIEALSLAIEKGELHLLNDPILVNELQAFEARRLPSGSLRYTAPEGQHDDCVMALAMAWHGSNATITPNVEVFG